MISITFDDGLLNTYDVAFSLMEKYALRGVLFVVTSTLPCSSASSWHPASGMPTMTLEQLRMLHKAGWEVGSHTVTHRQLDKISLPEAERELSESKKQLEAWGFSPVSLAYPYGQNHYTTDVRKLAMTHYAWARTVWDKPSTNHPPYTKDVLEATLGFNTVDPEDRTWQIFVFHAIEDKQAFDDWLRDLTAKNIRVVTFKDVLMEHESSSRNA